MNRFLIFAGDDYYGPSGWNSFVCAQEKLPSRERVLDLLRVSGHTSCDWWQVVDTATLSVVLKS